MSSRRPKPDSSEACSERTEIPLEPMSSSRIPAMAEEATKAVPCPQQRMRRILPDRSRSSRAGGRTSAPRLKRRRRLPSPSSANFPRRVFATETGDCSISLRKKWGKAPRSTSRVVICARFGSASPATGVPS